MDWLNMNSQTERLSRDDMQLADSPVAPSGVVEEKILSIWENVFSIDGLGVEDDFFDLNGTSLQAQEIADAVNAEFGAGFKSGQLVEHSTISRIAALISTVDKPEIPAHLVELRTSGDRTPLFFVHGAAGFLFPSIEFMNGFDPDQPVYAFQVPGYDGAMEPLSSVEELADEYLRCMLMVRPDGPYHIAGFCNGSWIVMEMARRLNALGKEVGRVIILDPGVLPGEMRKAFDLADARRNSGLLALARLQAAKLELYYKSVLAKYRFYRISGKWLDPRDPANHDHPDIRARHKDSINRKKKKSKKPAFKSEEELEVRRTPEAKDASSKLMLAFYRYVSDNPIPNRVDIIASEFLNERLANPVHPINVLMPNSNVIVFGKHHDDAVSTETAANSEIIQRLLHETDG